MDSFSSFTDYLVYEIKTARAGFLKLWYEYHQCYASQCSLVHGLSKKK